MPVYSITGRTTLVAATATPLAMLLKATTGSIARVSEVGVSMATAVASSIGLARSTTATTTPTSLGTPTPMNNRDAAGTAISAVAWATIGAATGGAFRRIALPATVGAGWVWMFDEPYIVGDQVSAATGELMLVNMVAVVPGLIDWYVSWRE